jgi:hypothetical protein
MYSGSNITASPSYLTEKGEGKMVRARGEQDGKIVCLSMFSVSENIYPLLISTQ